MQCVAMWCDAVCCNVVCCSVLQCGVMHYPTSTAGPQNMHRNEFVVQCVAVLQCVAVWCSVVQCGAVWCSVVQCVAVWCNVLQCGVVYCSVLPCVAESCSVLQCVAMWCIVLSYTHCGTSDHAQQGINTLQQLVATHRNTVRCSVLLQRVVMDSKVHTPAVYLCAARYLGLGLRVKGLESRV